jgi:Lipocalin-like domain
MDRRTFVASSMGVAVTSALSAAEQQSLHSRLLGVWSLTEAVTIKGNETLPWFGRRLPITGNLMYAESGWMSVQIAGGVPGTISRADFIKLPPADRVVWLDEYYAYYGTFEIDEVAHVVTHHVVNSLIPYEKATALKREVAIDRNILTLLTPPRDESGGRTFNRLVWKKAD